jgi:hypothetical protein
METRIGKIEDLAARAISRVADRWPPTTGSEEWLAVAYLVALHFLPCSALVAEGP